MKKLLCVLVFTCSLFISVSHAQSMLDSKDAIKCYAGNTEIIKGKLLAIQSTKSNYPGATGFNTIVYHDGKKVVTKVTNAICIIDLK